MQDVASTLYPYVFYGTVLALVLVEAVRPLRPAGASVDRRWPTNIGLFMISLAIQRLIAPATAIVAAEAAGRGSEASLLSALPEWTSIPAGIMLLDLWKYGEHRLSHRVAVLWRLHAVHHSDTEADFTTTERHHPLETVIGALALAGIVYALGMPPVAVGLYVLLASPVVLLSHANVRLNPKIAQRLRLIVVTPDFHMVHHSAERRETDSNFGVLLTLWDRLFGTYQEPTLRAARDRTIGLAYFRDAHSARLDRVLMQPFLSFEDHRSDSVDEHPRDQAAV